MRNPHRSARGIGFLVTLSVVAIPFGLMASPAVANDPGASDPSGFDPSAPVPSLAESASPKATYSKGSYFVEFRSRAAASYGHMYVIYGQVNGHGEIIKSDIAGLHPKGDANDCENCSLIPWTVGHVLFVPSETGASDGDLEEKYVTGRYRVMMDAAAFNRVAAYIRQKKAEKPLWNALVNNCVTFGNDIAGYMNLKTPSGANLMKPEEYIATLREMNGGKPQKGLRFAAPTSAKPAAAAPPAAPSKPKKEPVATLSSSPAAPPSPSPAVEVSGATR